MGIWTIPWKIDAIEPLMDYFEESHPQFTQLAKAVEEFRTYRDYNGGFIPN